MPLPIRTRSSLVPADVVHGIELWNCPALQARISEAQCQANREIARATPRTKMGPLFVTPRQKKNGVNLKRGLTPENDQWQAAMIANRKQTCAGCPGVKALARAEARRARREATRGGR